MSNANLFICGINFKLVVKIDELKMYLSPQILLNQIPWQVKVLKRSVQGEDLVDAFFVCTPALNESQWTCVAQATFTLESIGGEQRRYEISFPKTEFSKDANTKGFVPYMTWTKFMKYAHNDEVRFNVQLAANPILYMTPTRTMHFGATFRHIINNINQLTTDNTDEIQLLGTRWYVEFFKRDAHLGVSVHQIRDPQNENWAWEAKWSFALQSFDRNVQPIRKEIDHCFTSTSRSWVYSKLIKFSDLLDPVKKYVQNDATIFEVDLKVGDPKLQWNIGQEPSMNESLEQTVECSICLQNLVGRRPVTTKHGHSFCEKCIKSMMQAKCYNSKGK